jgi:hypothetical protein
VADIRYHFVSTGADSVAGQFLSIADAAKRSKKAAEESSSAVDKASRKASSGAGAGAAGGGGSRGASHSEKLALRVAADQDRAAKRGADAQVRESKRAATEQGKAAQYVAKIRDKHFADEQKSGERAAKRTADAQARESKRTAAEQARSAAYVAKIKDRHFATEQKNSERLEARKARELAANQRIHTRNQDAFRSGNEAAAEKRSDVRKAQAGNLVRSGAAAAAGLGLASLGVVGQAAREAVQLRDTANRISIGARGAGQAGVDPAVLAREFQRAAINSPGVKATDVAAGTASFVAKTGDLDAARRFAPTFATVASATGSSVEDIAGAASDIFQKFDITGVEEMQTALAALTFQGKSGAFELKDAASQFAKMSSAASRFGLSKGANGLKTLGGLSQIAQSATGSPEKTATSVSAMFRQLVMKSAKLKSQGVQVFEKGSHDTKTRDIQDILVETISKNKGSLPKLQDIFGDEGISAVTPLISKYNEAAGAVKGKDGGKATEAEKTAAGILALREALAKAIDAPGDWAEVVKDGAQAQASSGAQLDAAWEQLKTTVSDKVIPGLLPLIPSITRLANDGIGPMIGVFKSLVGAGEDVLSVLKWIGLVHPKVLTPTEQLDKAKSDLATFREKYDSRNHLATPEETKEKLRLEKAVADATVGAKAPTTHEEFVAAYSAAGREGGNDKIKKTLASAIASSVEKNPTGTAHPLGETDAQTDVRERYQKQLTGANGSGGSGAGAAPAVDASGVTAFNAAAAAAAANLDKIAKAGAPSVISGAQLGP